MVISVLERRSEIGLRRALGATRGQIRTQFLAEAILLSLAGGVAGVITGAAATAAYARAHGETVVIPPEAWAGGLAAALIIGALAGLLPAIRAARLSPPRPSGACEERGVSQPEGCRARPVSQRGSACGRQLRPGRPDSEPSHVRRRAACDGFSNCIFMQ